jgi:hypothetical protein
MGWWKIDPHTGNTDAEASSALSTEGMVLLNAVPEIDNEADACYLGDGPLDMVYSTTLEINTILGATDRPSRDEWRKFLGERETPAAILRRGAAIEAQLLGVVEQMWADIDWCYEEDWERPAREVEKRMLCENAADRLCP